MNSTCYPTVKERLARIIVAGTLAISVGAASTALPQEAHAAGDGTVTIAATDANRQPNNFKVYRLFVAEGGIDQNDIAKGLRWNDELKPTVRAFLDSQGYSAWLEQNRHTGENSAELPQNAAEFISERIANGPFDSADTEPPLTPAGGSFALQLAQALEAANPTTASYTAGDAFTDVEGYYLFVSNDSTVKTDEAGSAPIWVPLGGSTDGSEIVEKNAIPTLTKEVKEDSGDAWGLAADANAGQELEYRLTGTMPQNIGAFSSYHIKFVDTLPAGMELLGGSTKSVVVKIGDVDVTADIARSKGLITYAENILTVDIEDLLTLHEGLAIDKDSVVTVDYRAHLTPGCVLGSEGNINTSKLYYTKNPVSQVIGDPELPDEGTTGKTTKTYTYRLLLNKVDKQTAEPLPGAKFTVQVASANSDSASSGKYVDAQGELSDSAYAFTTGADGSFEVPRIDEGTYLIHETEAPEGYATAPDISVVIDSTLNSETGSLDALGATVSGGEGAVASTDVATHLDGDPEIQEGLVKVQTSDGKEVEMPLTGMAGTTAAAVYGTGSVALGLMGWAFARRKRGKAQVSGLEELRGFRG